MQYFILLLLLITNNVSQAEKEKAPPAGTVRGRPRAVNIFSNQSLDLSGIDLISLWPAVVGNRIINRAAGGNGEDRIRSQRWRRAVGFDDYDFDSHTHHKPQAGTHRRKLRCKCPTLCGKLKKPSSESFGESQAQLQRRREFTSKAPKTSKPGREKLVHIPVEDHVSVKIDYDDDVDEFSIHGGLDGETQEFHMTGLTQDEISDVLTGKGPCFEPMNEGHTTVRKTERKTTASLATPKTSHQPQKPRTTKAQIQTTVRRPSTSTKAKRTTLPSTNALRFGESTTKIIPVTSSEMTKAQSRFQSITTPGRTTEAHARVATIRESSHTNEAVVTVKKSSTAGQEATTATGRSTTAHEQKTTTEEPGLERTAKTETRIMHDVATTRAISSAHEAATETEGSSAHIKGTTTAESHTPHKETATKQISSTTIKATPMSTAQQIMTSFRESSAVTEAMATTEENASPIKDTRTHKEFSTTPHLAKTSGQPSTTLNSAVTPEKSSAHHKEKTTPEESGTPRKETTTREGMSTNVEPTSRAASASHASPATSQEGSSLSKLGSTVEEISTSHGVAISGTIISVHGATEVTAGKSSPPAQRTTTHTLRTKQHLPTTPGSSEVAHDATIATEVSSIPPRENTTEEVSTATIVIKTSEEIRTADKAMATTKKSSGPPKETLVAEETSSLPEKETVTPKEIRTENEVERSTAASATQKIGTTSMKLHEFSKVETTTEESTAAVKQGTIPPIISSGPYMSKTPRTSVVTPIIAAATMKTSAEEEETTSHEENRTESEVTITTASAAKQIATTLAERSTAHNSEATTEGNSNPVRGATALTNKETALEGTGTPKQTTEAYGTPTQDGEESEEGNAAVPYDVSNQPGVGRKRPTKRPLGNVSMAAPTMLSSQLLSLEFSFTPGETISHGTTTTVEEEPDEGREAMPFNTSHHKAHENMRLTKQMTGTTLTKTSSQPWDTAATIPLEASSITEESTSYSKPKLIPEDESEEASGALPPKAQIVPGNGQKHNTRKPTESIKSITAAESHTVLSHTVATREPTKGELANASVTTNLEEMTKGYSERASLSSTLIVTPSQSSASTTLPSPTQHESGTEFNAKPRVTQPSSKARVATSSAFTETSPVGENTVESTMIKPTGQLTAHQESMEQTTIKIAFSHPVASQTTSRTNQTSLPPAETETATPHVTALGETAKQATLSASMSVEIDTTSFANSSQNVMPTEGSNPEKQSTAHEATFATLASTPQHGMDASANNTKTSHLPTPSAFTGTKITGSTWRTPEVSETKDTPHSSAIKISTAESAIENVKTASTPNALAGASTLPAPSPATEISILPPSSTVMTSQGLKSTHEVSSTKNQSDFTTQSQLSSKASAEDEDFATTVIKHESVSGEQKSSADHYASSTKNIQGNTGETTLEGISRGTKYDASSSPMRLITHGINTSGSATYVPEKVTSQHLHMQWTVAEPSTVSTIPRETTPNEINGQHETPAAMKSTATRASSLKSVLSSETKEPENAVTSALTSRHKQTIVNSSPEIIYGETNIKSETFLPESTTAGMATTSFRVEFSDAFSAPLTEPQRPIGTTSHKSTTTLEEETALSTPTLQENRKTSRATAQPNTTKSLVAASETSTMPDRATNNKATDSEDQSEENLGALPFKVSNLPQHGKQPVVTGERTSVATAHSSLLTNVEYVSAISTTRDTEEHLSTNALQLGTAISLGTRSTPAEVTPARHITNSQQSVNVFEAVTTKASATTRSVPTVNGVAVTPSPTRSTASAAPFEAMSTTTESVKSQVVKSTPGDESQEDGGALPPEEQMLPGHVHKHTSMKHTPVKATTMLEDLSSTAIKPQDISGTSQFTVITTGLNAVRIPTTKVIESHHMSTPLPVSNHSVPFSISHTAFSSTQTQINRETSPASMTALKSSTIPHFLSPLSRTTETINANKLGPTTTPSGRIESSKTTSLSQKLTLPTDVRSSEATKRMLGSTDLPQMTGVSSVEIKHHSKRTQTVTFSGTDEEQPKISMSTPQYTSKTDLSPASSSGELTSETLSVSSSTFGGTQRATESPAKPTTEAQGDTNATLTQTHVKTQYPSSELYRTPTIRTEEFARPTSLLKNRYETETAQKNSKPATEFQTKEAPAAVTTAKFEYSTRLDAPTAGDSENQSTTPSEKDLNWKTEPENQEETKVAVTERLVSTDHRMNTVVFVNSVGSQSAPASAVSSGQQYSRDVANYTAASTSIGNFNDRHPSSTSIPAIATFPDDKPLAQSTLGVTNELQSNDTISALELSTLTDKEGDEQSVTITTESVSDGTSTTEWISYAGPDEYYDKNGYTKRKLRPEITILVIAAYIAKTRNPDACKMLWWNKVEEIVGGAKTGEDRWWNTVENIFSQETSLEGSKQLWWQNFDQLLIDSGRFNISAKGGSEIVSIPAQNLPHYGRLPEEDWEHMFENFPVKYESRKQWWAQVERLFTSLEVTKIIQAGWLERVETIINEIRESDSNGPEILWWHYMEQMFAHFNGSKDTGWDTVREVCKPHREVLSSTATPYTQRQLSTAPISMEASSFSMPSSSEIRATYSHTSEKKELNTSKHEEIITGSTVSAERANTISHSSTQAEDQVRTKLDNTTRTNKYIIQSSTLSPRGIKYRTRDSQELIAQTSHQTTNDIEMPTMTIIHEKTMKTTPENLVPKLSTLTSKLQESTEGKATQKVTAKQLTSSISATEGAENRYSSQRSISQSSVQVLSTKFATYGPRKEQAPTEHRLGTANNTYTSTTETTEQKPYTKLATEPAMYKVTEGFTRLASNTHRPTTKTETHKTHHSTYPPTSGPSAEQRTNKLTLQQTTQTLTSNRPPYTPSTEHTTRGPPSLYKTATKQLEQEMTTYRHNEKQTTNNLSAEPSTYDSMAETTTPAAEPSVHTSAQDTSVTQQTGQAKTEVTKAPTTRRWGTRQPLQNSTAENGEMTWSTTHAQAFRSTTAEHVTELQSHMPMTEPPLRKETVELATEHHTLQKKSSMSTARIPGHKPTFGPTRRSGNTEVSPGGQTTKPMTYVVTVQQKTSDHNHYLTTHRALNVATTHEETPFDPKRYSWETQSKTSKTPTPFHPKIQEGSTEQNAHAWTSRPISAPEMPKATATVGQNPTENAQTTLQPASEISTLYTKAETSAHESIAVSLTYNPTSVSLKHSFKTEQSTRKVLTSALTHNSASVSSKQISKTQSKPTTDASKHEQTNIMSTPHPSSALSTREYIHLTGPSSRKPFTQQSPSKSTVKSKTNKPMTELPMIKITSEPLAHKSTPAPHADSSRAELSTHKHISEPSTHKPESERSTHNPKSEPSTHKPESEPSTGDPTSEPFTHEPEAEFSTYETESEPSTHNPESEPSPHKPESEPSTRKTESEPSTHKPESEPSTHKPESEPSTHKPESEPSTHKPESAPSPHKPESAPSTHKPVSEPSTHTTKSEKPPGGSESVPSTLNPKSEPSTHKPESEPSTHKPESEPSTHKPRSELSTHNPGSEPSTHKPESKPSTHKPGPVPSTHKPVSEPSTHKSEQPTGKTESEPSTHNPGSEPSTHEPESEPSTHKPGSVPSTHKPVSEPSTHKSEQPTGEPESEPSTHEPEAELSTHKPKSKPSTHRPESETSTHKPKSKPSTHRPESETSTHKPKSKPSTHRPESETSTHKPISEPSRHKSKSELSTHKPESEQLTREPESEPSTLDSKSEPSTHKPEVEISTYKPESEPSTYKTKSEQPTREPESEPSTLNHKSEPSTHEPEAELSTRKSESEPSTHKTKSEQPTHEPESEPSTLNHKSEPYTHKPEAGSSTREPESEPSSLKPRSEPPTYKPEVQLSTYKLETELSTHKPKSEQPTREPGSEPSTLSPKSEPSTHKSKSEQPTREPESEPSTLNPKTEPSTHKPESETYAHKPSSEPFTHKPSSEPFTPKPRSEPFTPKHRSELSTHQPVSRPSTSKPKTEPSTHRTESESPKGEPESKASTRKPEVEPSTQTPEFEPSTRELEFEPSTHEHESEPSTYRPAAEPSTHKPGAKPCTHKPSSTNEPDSEPSTQKPELESSTHKLISEAATRKPHAEPSTYKPELEPSSNPGGVSPTREPESEQPTGNPKSAPSTSKPAVELSTHKPGAEPSTQTPEAEPSTHKPSSQLTNQSTNKPTSEHYTEERTPEHSTHGPTSEYSTHNPTFENSTHKATSRRSTHEPTSEHATNRPSGEPSTRGPNLEPSSGRPSLETSTHRPRSAQSTHRPSSVNSSHAPTSEHSTHKPTIERSTHKPTPERSTHKPSSEHSAHKPTPEHSTHKLTSGRSTYKPTREDSTHKPTSERSTYKPISEHSAHKPTSKHTSKRLTETANTEQSIPTATEESEIRKPTTTSLLNERTTKPSVQRPTAVVPSRTSLAESLILKHTTESESELTSQVFKRKSVSKSSAYTPTAQSQDYGHTQKPSIHPPSGFPSTHDSATKVLANSPTVQLWKQVDTTQPFFHKSTRQRHTQAATKLSSSYAPTAVPSTHNLVKLSTQKAASVSSSYGDTTEHLKRNRTDEPNSNEPTAKPSAPEQTAKLLPQSSTAEPPTHRYTRESSMHKITTEQLTHGSISEPLKRKSTRKSSAQMATTQPLTHEHTTQASDHTSSCLELTHEITSEVPVHVSLPEPSALKGKAQASTRKPTKEPSSDIPMPRSSMSELITHVSTHELLISPSTYKQATTPLTHELKTQPTMHELTTQPSKNELTTLSSVRNSTEALTHKPRTEPSTHKPTTEPSTHKPTTGPSTRKPSTEPSTHKPSTEPSTHKPTTDPSTHKPTIEPSTLKHKTELSTLKPTTEPSTLKPTTEPSTIKPTTEPSTLKPTTEPSTHKPTTEPSTLKPTTEPLTHKPTIEPSTHKPKTDPSTIKPTTEPSTLKPTTEPSTLKPTTEPSTIKPTTEPSTLKPTTEPSTHKLSTEPTTDNPTESISITYETTLTEEITYTSSDTVLTSSATFSSETFTVTESPVPITTELSIDEDEYIDEYYQKKKRLSIDITVLIMVSYILQSKDPAACQGSWWKEIERKLWDVLQTSDTDEILWKTVESLYSGSNNPGKLPWWKNVDKVNESRIGISEEEETSGGAWWKDPRKNKTAPLRVPAGSGPLSAKAFDAARGSWWGQVQDTLKNVSTSSASQQSWWMTVQKTLKQIRKTNPQKVSWWNELDKTFFEFYGSAKSQDSLWSQVDAVCHAKDHEATGGATTVNKSLVETDEYIDENGERKKKLTIEITLLVMSSYIAVTKNVEACKGSWWSSAEKSFEDNKSNRGGDAWWRLVGTLLNETTTSSGSKQSWWKSAPKKFTTATKAAWWKNNGEAQGQEENLMPPEYSNVENADTPEGPVGAEKTPREAWWDGLGVALKSMSTMNVSHKSWLDRIEKAIQQIEKTSGVQTEWWHKVVDLRSEVGSTESSIASWWHKVDEVCSHEAWWRVKNSEETYSESEEDDVVTPEEPSTTPIIDLEIDKYRDENRTIRRKLSVEITVLLTVNYILNSKNQDACQTSWWRGLEQKTRESGSVTDTEDFWWQVVEHLFSESKRNSSSGSSKPSWWQAVDQKATETTLAPLRVSGTTTVPPKNSAWWKGNSRRRRDSREQGSRDAWWDQVLTLVEEISSSATAREKWWKDVEKEYTQIMKTSKTHPAWWKEVEGVYNESSRYVTREVWAMKVKATCNSSQQDNHTRVTWHENVERLCIYAGTAKSKESWWKQLPGGSSNGSWWKTNKPKSTSSTSSGSKEPAWWKGTSTWWEHAPRVYGKSNTTAKFHQSWWTVVSELFGEISVDNPPKSSWWKKIEYWFSVIETASSTTSRKFTWDHNFEHVCNQINHTTPPTRARWWNNLENLCRQTRLSITKGQNQWWVEVPKASAKVDSDSSVKGGWWKYVPKVSDLISDTRGFHSAWWEEVEALLGQLDDSHSPNKDWWKRVETIFSQYENSTVEIWHVNIEKACSIVKSGKPPQTGGWKVLKYLCTRIKSQKTSEGYWWEVVPQVYNASDKWWLGTTKYIFQPNWWHHTESHFSHTATQAKNSVWWKEVEKTFSKLTEDEGPTEAWWKEVERVFSEHNRRRRRVRRSSKHEWWQIVEEVCFGIAKGKWWQQVPNSKQDVHITTVQPSQSGKNIPGSNVNPPGYGQGSHIPPPPPPPGYWYPPAAAPSYNQGPQKPPSNYKQGGYDYPPPPPPQYNQGLYQKSPSLSPSNVGKPVKPANWYNG